MKTDNPWCTVLFFLRLSISVFISSETYVSSSCSIPTVTSSRLIEVRICSAPATSHMNPIFRGVYDTAITRGRPENLIYSPGLNEMPFKADVTEQSTVRAALLREQVVQLEWKLRDEVATSNMPLSSNSAEGWRLTAGIGARGLEPFLARSKPLHFRQLLPDQRRGVKGHVCNCASGCTPSPWLTL